MEQEFVALGHAGSDAYAGLETFPNPGVERVELVSDELTAFCPITHQPDFYTATIAYEPGELCLESKSLKIYLSRFHDQGVFCEALAVQIRDEVAEALQLERGRVHVTLRQKARGGITITAFGVEKQAGRPIVRRPRVVDDRQSDPPECGYSYSAYVVALAVPANAVAGGRVSAFYYPWYGTSSADGSYQHWSQDGHAPPNDIASSYYPAIGLYSSSDKLVIDAQMSEIRGAGIDEIAVSWWGQGSPEDLRMPAIVAPRTSAACSSPRTSSRIAGGPSSRSRPTSRTSPAGSGSRRSTSTSRSISHRATGPTNHPLLHPVPDITVYAQTALAGAAAVGAVRRRLHLRHRHVRRQQLPPALRGSACDAPAMRSVGRPGVQREAGQRRPGRQAAQARPDLRRDVARSARERRGQHHDHVVQRVARGNADRARRGRVGARRYRYLSYDGAWGLHGAAAESAYLVRTRYWTDVFHKTLPLQPKTKAS